MRVEKAKYYILTPITGDELKEIEVIGRTCYKSEDLITDDSAEKFVRGLIKRGHEAMLEHKSLTVIFKCDRGISHELVRHRMASFAQESTRYCNYSKDKFGNEITFIVPFTADIDDMYYKYWLSAMKACEESYLQMIKNGISPEMARAVLPNSLKTEVIMTANYREWRHFFKLRAADVTGKAHPQMKELTVPLLMELDKKIPVIFEDIVAEINNK